MLEPYEDNVSQLGMPLAVGLYVNAEVLGRTISNAVVIPPDALRAGDQVYVIKDGKLDVRTVSVMHNSDSSIVLRSGVEAAEQLVVSAIRNPIPGMPLTALGERAVAAGAP